MTVPKDVSVDLVLERLRADLGGDSFTVVHHWGGDLCAVGVARPADPRYLVYISTWPPERGTFTYECERPSADPDAPYDSDGMVEDVSHEDVRETVRRHLRV